MDLVNNAKCFKEEIHGMINSSISIFDPQICHSGLVSNYRELLFYKKSLK